MNVRVKVKKTSPDVKLPVYATSGAACMDVYANIDTRLRPHETVAIDTGLCFEIPEGYEIQFRPRSGLAMKEISILNSPATIDEDFRGTCMVILHNGRNEDFIVKRFDRICQATIKKVLKIEWEEAEELSDTERGVGCFGSTGIRELLNNQQSMPNDIELWDNTLNDGLNELEQEELPNLLEGQFWSML